jgi:hypothetical protein
LLEDSLLLIRLEKRFRSSSFNFGVESVIQSVILKTKRKEMLFTHL